jgi:(2Fe-2S) ferredoxin
LFYQHHVFCCTNRRADGHERGSCAAKGSEQLRNYMKSKAKELGIPSTRINGAGCLDRCELGPVVVVYPEGIWYRCETKQDIDEVLAALKAGEVVERLRLSDDQK